MHNLICCVNQPNRPFTTLLPETASRARSWNTAMTLQFPLTYCILVLEVWLQVSPAQTAIHQPCSICTGSQFNDPQGVDWTRLWISLPESNYSSGQASYHQQGQSPFCHCVRALMWDYITLCFSAHSSMVGPSSRCVDENWGGSPKSKLLLGAKSRRCSRVFRSSTWEAQILY